ncbi:hypothetical protein BGW38_007722 [Lunasporangiospora selenospora]|uniref:Elongation factor P n=1 Tax=Lunasporangiospora selenospora TaxID=979761 RepID=A0A9P6FL49_9FUNG|nr:hypothetical protein BGW38_007722 [Lunasporangiospora selenospora]
MQAARIRMGALTRLSLSTTRSPLSVSRASLTQIWTQQERGYKTSVLEVRKSYVVELGGKLSVVLKRESSVLEVQDLFSGTKHTHRFRSDDMVEVTELIGHKCQFLYKAEGQLHLMDPDNFEMYEVPENVLEEKQIQMLLPDMLVQLSMFQPDPEQPGKPISIKLPAHAPYVVRETHPSAAQANKGTVFKNAELDNAIKVQVPDFVNVGDKVIVDTDTGKYVKRA